MARDPAPVDLIRAVMALSGLLRQSIAETLAPHDVTPEQQELLSLLAEGLRSPAELIAASGRDKTTLSRAITRAAGAGLLVQERRSDDRRRQVLQLTQSGAALSATTASVVARRAPALVSALSPKERRRLSKIIKKLRKSLRKQQI
jgi:DNA-binding MarR family transcriptional regulator